MKYVVRMKRSAGGWEQRTINARSMGEAAHLAVRETHQFLTDDNHDWKFWKSGRSGTRYLSIVRNKNSPDPLLAPAWVERGVGSTWFTIQVTVRKAVAA